MKKILMLACLFMLSVSVQARELTCSIVVMEATEDGVKVAREYLRKWSRVGPVQAPAEDYLCPVSSVISTDYKGYSLQLCANEEFYTGGYRVKLIVDQTEAMGFGYEAQNFSYLVTTKNSGELDTIRSESQINLKVLGLLESAGLSELNPELGDSRMDKIIGNAVKTGILKKGQVVSFVINNCQFTQ